MASKNGTMTVSEMGQLGARARWRKVPKDERTALATLWGKRGAEARWGRKRKRRKAKARRKSSP